MNGTVKFFNKEKGFGFITRENGKDIFVHHSSVPKGVDLREGDEVTFEEGEGQKGIMAVNIELA